MTCRDESQDRFFCFGLGNTEETFACREHLTGSCPIRSIRPHRHSPSGSYTSHVAAFFGAAVTHFCALLAMLRFMTSALVATGLADVSTDAANVHGLLAAEAHELRCSIADGCTFHVELYATSHHLNVCFLRAR